MLADKELKAFIPTLKPEKAKLFYRNILGLELLSEDNYALEFKANGILLRVIIVPDLKPQEFNVLGWNVPDIISTIKSLEEKGVFCENYAKNYIGSQLIFKCGQLVFLLNKFSYKTATYIGTWRSRL